MSGMNNNHEGGTRVGKWRLRVTFLALVAVVGGVLTLAASPAGAADHRIVVREGQSIQAAIDAADPGDTIVVYGVHEENIWINKPGLRLVGWNATIRAAAAEPGTSACFPFPMAPVPVICVAPASEGPPAPADYLDGVTIVGFTVDASGTEGDGIATVFVNNVKIRHNTVTDAGCDGIFVIFSTGFAIDRNEVHRSGCQNINVNASTDGRVRRNVSMDAAGNGIGFGDVSNASIRANRVEGNCMGIVATDGNDMGAGIREEPFPSVNIRIVNNVSNGNNKSCPFGPEVLVGQTGIIVAGVDGVLVKGNTANDNVGTAETITFGGISVADFPDPSGVVFPTTNARVIGNTATGNSTPAGPADLVVGSEELPKLRRNTCDVGFPDPSFCS